MRLAMMLVQLAAAPPPDIELKPSLQQHDCDCCSVDEILVCGRSDESRYRLKPFVDSGFEQEQKAETTLFDTVTGAAELESAELAGGVTSQRMMFRVKLPF